MHEHRRAALTSTDGRFIALVGNPNVGKSAVFNYLTGQRVSVSNYPGTTVEVARGVLKSYPAVALVDTPGVITFPPRSEDERIPLQVLLQPTLQGVIQVGDAKNLQRTLLLTAQLLEMGLPLVLALNMADEASARQVEIDLETLRQRLGIAVLATAAVRRQGLDELAAAALAAQPGHCELRYADAIEEALQIFAQLLAQRALRPPIGARALGLLWLSGDTVSAEWLQSRLGEEDLAALQVLQKRCQEQLQGEVADAIQAQRLARVEELTRQALRSAGRPPEGLGARLGRLTTHPLWGWLFLALSLYGLYWFVGVFGAGTLVGLLEEELFGRLINPALISWLERLIPWPFVVQLLVGEYGLWTMGMTYALALILPIVTTFFLAFGLLEDSGYLPRLAVLSNRLFRFLGLNGKAVLPMVLGLGCVTMATVTTRVLESRRERLLATFLLALAIPCSAQLGVVMGMLAGISFSATLIWLGGVVTVLLVVGWLAARLVPGERLPLLVELPPLRWPLASNVLLKTLARLEWYLKEVVPLFLLGSLLMFGLDQSGWLQKLIRAGEPLVVGWLGLPPQASAAFLMGFLRRDFGATGLFLMQSHGQLSAVQVVVAMVTITLFVPCIASVMMIGKERGWKTALGILGVVIPLAFLIGGLLNRLLLAIGWAG